MWLRCRTVRRTTLTQFGAVEAHYESVTQHVSHSATERHLENFEKVKLEFAL